MRYGWWERTRKMGYGRELDLHELERRTSSDYVYTYLTLIILSKEHFPTMGMFELSDVALTEKRLVEQSSLLILRRCTYFI